MTKNKLVTGILTACLLAGAVIWVMTAVLFYNAAKSMQQVIGQLSGDDRTTVSVSRPQPPKHKREQLRKAEHKSANP